MSWQIVLSFISIQGSLSLTKICAWGSIGSSKVLVLTAILPLEILYLQKITFQVVLKKYKESR